MNWNLHPDRTSLDLRCVLTGLTLMLLSLLMRLAALTPAGSALAAMEPRQLWTLAVQALTAPSVSAATASTEVSRQERPPKMPAKAVLHTASEADAAADTTVTTAEPLSFTPAEADAISIHGTSTYEVNKASLLQAGPVTTGGDGPKVLIVHSHTTEAYTQTPGWEYTPASGAYRTLDEQANMLRIGARVAEVLEACGIGAVHDTAVNDDPSYQDAYDRSAQRIEAQLAAYPTIEVILDLHRDAAEDPDGEAVALSSSVNGSSVAQLMLVVGTDEGGLPHPDWQQNLSFALQLQAWIGRSYPDLCRSLSLCQARFNQHYTPASLLVEVGSTGNTMPEALLSAELFARELAGYLHSAAAGMEDVP